MPIIPYGCARDAACGYCDPQPDRASWSGLYRCLCRGNGRLFFKSGPETVPSPGPGAPYDALCDQAPKPGVKQRFLDVGCNGGFMVQAAVEAGFEAFGLDPDPVSIAYATAHYPAGHFTHAFLEDYRSPRPNWVQTTGLMPSIVQK